MQLRARMPGKPETFTQAESSGSHPAYQEISSSEDDEDDLPLRHVRSRKRPVKPAASSASKSEPGISSNTKKYNWRNKPAQPISTKSVSKNDMQAKAQLIREIERCWGKDFIQKYIPKCHRPLTKRKNKKRSIYRNHEIDPKNWLPSVLKAILMVAKQTDDKAALKKAMNEVVRYRIKHTGNRKPQLVTTDFDVIEDIVMKGWKCQDSFKIRYKHLLSAQSANIHVSNAEVDAIMYPDSSYQDTDEDAPPKKNRRVHHSDSEIEEAVDEELGENEEAVYVQSHPFFPPKKIIQPKQTSSKETNTSKAAVPKKPAQIPNIRYSEEEKEGEDQDRPEQQPFNGYNAPSGFPNYPPFGGYGYPPYGYHPQFKGYLQPLYGHPPFNPYPHYGNFNPSCPPKDPRSEQAGTPESHSYNSASQRLLTPSPGVFQNPHIRSRSHQHDLGGHDHFSSFGNLWRPSQQPVIKQEPGTEDYLVSIEGHENISGSSNKPINVEDDDNQIDMDYLDEKTKLELEAAEAEARLAKMRANAAKVSRAAKAKHMSRQHVNSRYAV